MAPEPRRRRRRYRLADDPGEAPVLWWRRDLRRLFAAADATRERYRDMISAEACKRRQQRSRWDTEP